jgi:hypothetical protein
MELKFSVKSLLSKQTRVWYVLNRFSLLLVIFCLYLATKPR